MAAFVCGTCGNSQFIVTTAASNLDSGVPADAQPGVLHVPAKPTLICLHCTTLWQFTGSTWVKLTQVTAQPINIFPIL